MTQRAVFMGAVAVTAAALMACRNMPDAGVAQDTSYRARPGYIIDSVRPIEVELTRFRANLGPAPTALTGGSESLDGLITRFARAVEAKDTAALQRMQVSIAEYAWLVYPSSPMTKPPYQQAPQIAWMLMSQASDAGLGRVVQRRGGSALRIAGHHCDPTPMVEGENMYWRRCVVRTVVGTDTTEERLFGNVIERHGHFKFASYQNQY